MQPPHPPAHHLQNAKRLKNNTLCNCVMLLFCSVYVLCVVVLCCCLFFVYVLQCMLCCMLLCLFYVYLFVCMFYVLVSFLFVYMLIKHCVYLLNYLYVCYVYGCTYMSKELYCLPYPALQCTYLYFPIFVVPTCLVLLYLLTY